MTIACIIPTYNGAHELRRLMESLNNQTIGFDIFIVDSSSKDGTLDVARQYTKNVTSIHSDEFNHGGTRQHIINQNPDYDIYILLTQDACLATPDALAKLVEPFADPKIGAVCGRQLPHSDATLFAQHARMFSYPQNSQIKSLDDIQILGIRAAFMSNSFAAYRGEALKAVGGFPVHVIFAEDMYVAAKMLLAKWHVAYAGNAECYHSHNYNIMEEFGRYFDMGVFHARESWLRLHFGGSSDEGYRFVKSELKFLGCHRLYLWPIALLRNLFKLLGYKAGQKEARLPVFLKSKIGMYKRFWSGAFSAK